MDAGYDDPLADRPADAATKYVLKLLPVMRDQGFNHLRIEDIVRIMDISRATFYNHFAAKEAVVARVAALHTLALERMRQRIVDETRDYAERFHAILRQTLLSALYDGEAFARDLKLSYPALWEQLSMARHARQRELVRFYAAGIAAGALRPNNPALGALQDDVMVRAIIAPTFYQEQRLTLGELLRDYAMARATHWLGAPIVDPTTTAYLELIAAKILLYHGAPFTP